MKISDLAEVFNNSDLFFVLNDDKISMQSISNRNNDELNNGININIETVRPDGRSVS